MYTCGCLSLRVTLRTGAPIFLNRVGAQAQEAAQPIFFLSWPMGPQPIFFKKYAPHERYPKEKTKATVLRMLKGSSEGQFS